MQSTPISLLERLRLPGEAAAWDRFTALYTPLLYHWARRLGLQESDAADLVQEVFAVLVCRLPDFRYETGKRFRGWLWTTLVNKYREGRRRRSTRPSEAAGVDLNGLAGPDAMTAREETEYSQYVVAEAMRLVRPDFEPATWRACWEYAVRGRPAAEVAAEMGLTVNAVHLAKSRVLRRLRQELDGLLD